MYKLHKTIQYDKKYLVARRPYVYGGLAFLIAIFPCVANLSKSEWLAFCKFMQDNTWISILFSAVIAGSIAGMAIRYNRRTARENNALDFDAKYKASDRVNESWSTIATYVVGMSDEQLRNIAATREKDLLGEDSELYHSLRFIYNEWERAGNAINHNLYDEDFLFKAHAGNVIRLYDRTYSFIEERRKKDERIFINFVALAMRWKVRKAIEDGQPRSNYHMAKRYSQALKAALNESR